MTMKSQSICCTLSVQYRIAEFTAEDTSMDIRCSLCLCVTIVDATASAQALNFVVRSTSYHKSR